MGFASAWLAERAIFPQFIAEPPQNNTGIIIVVPAYNEPEISILLNSLNRCSEPGCGVEVIIVVNAPLGSPPEHLENNRITVALIEDWKRSNSHFFRLFCIKPQHSSGDWGVGLARKTGMDEALRRFDLLGMPGGIILCLDADCTVESGYLVALENELLLKKNRSACSIYFEHPLSGSGFPETACRAIIQYELHLRYYYQGLNFSGFPYVFHTVGSALAVKALPYMKAGGMNRKQAGEDFYFIQKLVPTGGYFSLNSTTVYPSPRTSFRVPFGTGATMEKLSKESRPVLTTYNFEAFRELQEIFSGIDNCYKCSQDELSGVYKQLPRGMKIFIPEDEWCARIIEIRTNTSGFSSFRKRFFGWFNMFRVVKFLNCAHMGYLDKKPVAESAAELLRSRGIAASNDPLDLLGIYRSLEKESAIFP